MDNEFLTQKEVGQLIQIGSKNNAFKTLDDDFNANFYKSKNNNPNVTIWLADLTHTNSRIISDHMPYGIGCVSAFTEKNIHLQTPIRLFKYPEKLNLALEKDGVPDIIGFSNFVWNSELSSAFAKRIKELHPETIVIFGGPHYPLDRVEREKFLRDHPQIDFYIPKEGELAFYNLVAYLIDSNLDKSKIKNNLRSVHSIGNNGEAFITEEIPRIPNLTLVPSPYTTGKFDEFFDGTLLPVIQTNRGCPFACTFCDEGISYYNKINRRERWQIDLELEYIARKMMEIRNKGGRNDLRIADSNFGMYREDLITCETIARCRQQYNWPEEIVVDTGKNAQERVLTAAEIVDGIMTINGSVQSLDNVVMKNMKRDNISSEGLMQIALQASKKKVSSITQLILCLPGETKKSHFESIFKVIDANFTHVTIFQLGIEPGAEMFLPEEKKRFGLEGRYRIMAECIGNYEILGKKLTVGELEEICYETNTMPFADYVSCRKMNLIVSIFYNTFSLYWNSRTSRPFFDGILKFLRLYKIPISRWMELLHEEKMDGELKEAFDAFEKASREELWEDTTELKKFIQEPQVVEKFLNGTLGYNLIHTFRILILTRYIDSLKDFVRRTIWKILEENGKDSDENMAFANDVLEFESSRVKNISKNIDQIPEITLEYDIFKFKDDENPTSVKDYKLTKPITVKFVLDELQKKVIKQTIQEEGNEKLTNIGNVIKTSSLSLTLSKDVLRKPLR